MSGSKGFRGSQSFVWDTSKPLGQGATSIVYMGRNKKTGDEVAVKVFNTVSLQRPLNVQLREFEVMKRLNHENIVKLIAVEEEVPNGVNVIVMEYCAHGNLYNLLEMPENNFGLVEDEFLNVLQQVTAGVKHLRDSDIIHRDIKPGNILRSIMADGRSVYKLTDFGAARELQQDEEFYSMYGTDEYLHPDMYEKAVLRRGRGQHFGLYVDLWSLGVTFYHAATGSLPFRPYGGRRNRETMHLITTKKEQGVISGIQSREAGPVEWSRDLPDTCRLSRGLKSLITPLLASLLEKDQGKTISFEEFFAHINDITARIPYHVFCPSSFSLLTIYTRDRDDMSQIRQLITDQTEIPGGAQLLLHDGKVLAYESREPVASLMRIETKGNPIFVYNKLPEYKGFTKPAVGVFLDIPIITCVESDYPLSKKILSVLHSMKHAVRSLKTCTDHMHTAVKMYSDHVNRKCQEMEQFLIFTKKTCSDSSLFKEQLFSLVEVESKLLQILAKNTNSSVANSAHRLRTLQETGKRECTQINIQIQSRLEKADVTLRDIKKGQSQDGGWDRRVGCTAADKCIEQMDVLNSRLHKIVSTFKEDRAKRHLNNNEEQIHRVDKHKMKELTITARTLLEDHCIRKSHSLYMGFKQFYSKKVQINDTVEKLNSDLKDLNEQQSRLVYKLRTTHRECMCQANEGIKDLEKSEKASERLSSGRAKSVSSDAGLSSSDSRSEKLGTVLNSLHSWSENLLEVKQLLKENTMMISRFGENIAPLDNEEEKSWEMVGANGIPSEINE